MADEMCAGASRGLWTRTRPVGGELSAQSHVTMVRKHPPGTGTTHRSQGCGTVGWDKRANNDRAEVLVPEKKRPQCFKGACKFGYRQCCWLCAKPPLDATVEDEAIHGPGAVLGRSRQR